jgi:hypothetical protein
LSRMRKMQMLSFRVVYANRYYRCR